MHIALLGDSIFDNAAYVAPGQDVAAALRQQRPGWRVSLLAQDGAVLANVPGQVARLRALAEPPDRIVLSCGGNDILPLTGMLHSPCATILAGLEQLAAWRGDFRDDYRRMLDAVLAVRLPVAVCTVYDAVPGLTPGVRCAAAVFNDVIVFEARARNVPVLDLRAVCTEPGDYSARSPIEPSAAGGVKIAAAIAALVG
jgi:hypothetical protein